MKNIIFLYAEMVPSWMPTFNILAKDHGCAVNVVHWDHKKKTPYIPPEVEGVSFYNRSQFTQGSLERFVDEIKPDVIFISGWMDKGYLKAVIRARARQVPVVSGFDDWWTGSIRQRFATLIPSSVRRLFFSHAWVAGPRQYEFAKRIGFQDSEIIFNLLSCDTSAFNDDCGRPQEKRIDQFLYIGRFSEEKGIGTLMDGYEQYRKERGGTWSLLCIGNGPLKYMIERNDKVDLLPFLEPEELKKYFRCSGAFLLPSERDFSPLVVHEAACASMPLILSSNVGNISTFGINKYNAFIFEAGSARDLANVLKRMEETDCQRRKKMGENSKTLSLRISPEICAASLLSII